MTRDAIADQLRSVPLGPQPAVERSWSADDALLYAVAVGAGHDPVDELAFTTENSRGVTQQVLPTFATLLDSGLPRWLLDELPLERMVHGYQRAALHRPLPVSGRAIARPSITGVHDLGRHALIRYETELTDSEDQRPLATLSRGLILRGLGGFDGDPAPPTLWSRPDRPEDDRIVQTTRPEQALIYRLCRDRNPLHSDPAVARRAGFDRPILHGLCTLGFVARALTAKMCDGHADRFGSVHVRFSRPVTPGQQLITHVWHVPEGAVFQVTSDAGALVIDHGEFRRREE